jgi:hypothetical protein
LIKNRRNLLETIRCLSALNQNQRFSNQLFDSHLNRARQQVPLPKYSPSAACPERNGRYPVQNQCDAYIECIDGVAEEKLCPEGLVYNPEARFNYPCGYPIDVDCAGRPNLREFSLMHLQLRRKLLSVQINFLPSCSKLEIRL